jgi:hypothetical protein|tara:strand:- start:310 stop:639 length:330 start_codon:yes stop_codon:yes gene_type:complete
MKLKDNVTLTETVEKLNKKNIKLLKQVKDHEEEVIELNEYIDSLEAQITDYKRRFVPDFDMLAKGGESVPISDLKIMSDKARRSMAKRFLKKYGEEWVRINILENKDLK